MIGVDAGPARHARLVLPGNLPLIEAVAAALAPLGWPSATLMLLGGALARAVYTCSVVTPGGPRWIDYGPQRDLGACYLAYGNATFGTAFDTGGGAGPALHVHGILCPRDGEPQGGHLVPDLTVTGPAGLVAHAVSGAGAAFRMTADPSGFNLLAPAP